MNGETPELLMSKKDSTGLASYIRHHRMTEEGIDRASLVLSDFQGLLKAFDIEGHAFATAALRNIDNSEEAVDQIVRASGLQIQVIPGEMEAELDFVGATRGMKLSTGLLVDIGGASTELVVYKDQKIQKAISMPLGSLSMYNQYVENLLPTKQERKNIEQAVLAAIATDEDFFAGRYKKIDGICGVGGTIRAACKLNNDMFELPTDNHVINTANVKKILKKLETPEGEQFISTGKMDTLLRVVPDRIRTVLPGMIILQTVIKYFKAKMIHVSFMGVREGYLYQQVLGKGEPFTPAE
jgi:exopolyphosphatase/guanosine-5'-triphosphate,3'-diphosphate pyrophosphatase